MFALMLAAACSDDSFNDIQGDLDRLVASPTQVFLEVGESKNVTVSGVDGQGNPLTFNYEVTNEGAGIDVRRDSTFLPIYVDDSTLQVPAEGERFRFIVTGTAYTSTTFTVSAGGQDIVIPVQVVPQNTLEAAISNQAPALGETITITAPAGTHFSATSVVTQPDPNGAQPFVVSVAADGSSLDVILPPNLTEAQLTISDVTSDAAPTVTFAPHTALTVTTTQVPSYTGTFSNLTPDVNEAVTLTLGGGQTFTADADLILGAGAPTITNLTTNTVTFIPAPGTTALLVANGVILPELPDIPLSLAAPATDTIVVSPDIPTTPGTTASATAPSLVVPGLDRSSVLFDKPPFDADAIVDAYYKLEITQEGVYTITMNWDIGDDIDMFVCPAAGVDAFDCDFQAASASHPEVGEYALTPGTYFVLADDFAAYDDDATTAPAVGTTLQINVDHAAPEAVLVAKAKSLVRTTRK